MTLPASLQGAEALQASAPLSLLTVAPTWSRRLMSQLSSYHDARPQGKDTPEDKGHRKALGMEAHGRVVLSLSYTQFS